MHFGNVETSSCQSRYHVDIDRTGKVNSLVFKQTQVVINVPRTQHSRLAFCDLLLVNFTQFIEADCRKHAFVTRP